MAAESDPREKRLDDLIRDVNELRSRLEAVERRVGVGERIEADWVDAALEPGHIAEASFEQTGRLAPLIGTSLLGLAGAYLLRAMTERQSLQVGPGVGLGILYAAAWLFLAARSAGAGRAAVIARSLTAVLILMPLLWEAEMRFHALPSWATAVLLVAFAVYGLAVAWRRNINSIAWITSMAGLITMAGLLIATKDLLPFTWALLGLALAMEICACLEHWMKERWIIAMSVNLAVLLITFVLTRPSGLPEGYAPIARGEAIAVQAALLAVYLASTFVRTLYRDFTISGFEISQCVIAFAIATVGSLRVAQGHPTAVVAVGVISAVGGVICYGAAFVFVSRHMERDRNFYVYATFGLLLVLTGSRLLMPGAAWVLFLALMAVAFVGAGRESGRVTLKWHGAVYLLLAMFGSGFVGALAPRFLGGSAHAAASPSGLALWVSMPSAVLCYLLILRGNPPPRADWSYKGLVTVLALAASWSAAAVAAGLLAPRCPNGAESSAADFCPTVITAVLTLTALGLASATLRWSRFELGWVAWAFLALATYKLLIQDFRQGETLAIVLSLLLYGGALVLLPRILQRGAATAKHTAA